MSESDLKTGIMTSGPATLDSSTQDGRLELAAAGYWTADNAGKLERLVDRAARMRRPPKQVAIDLRAIKRMDTYGAWLVERLQRAFSERGCETTFVGMQETYSALMEELSHIQRTPARTPRDAHGLLRALDLVGRATVEAMRSLLLLVNMLGSLVAAIFRVLIRPQTFRFTSMVFHLERVGWRAVPIILLITFLIGAIVAQQGIFHFRRFGADVFVIDLIGVLVLRELGVLIVCIMVAGRSGSSYTAELGSMKMREEVDALQTMGFDPVEVLVLPRILALLIAVPTLTFLGSMSALYGGGLVCWLYGGIEPDVFLARLRDAISFTHFQVGMIKAPFMALIIGLVAANEGMLVKGSAQSLGQQTTSSVVKSIFLVIVVDGVFAIVFASLGM